MHGCTFTARENIDAISSAEKSHPSGCIELPGIRMMREVDSFAKACQMINQLGFLRVLVQFVIFLLIFIIFYDVQ